MAKLQLLVQIMKMAVELNLGECFAAAITGTMRMIWRLFGLHEDNYQNPDKDAKWQSEIEGAGAEIAFAKAINIYWSPRFSDFTKEAWVPVRMPKEG